MTEERTKLLEEVKTVDLRMLNHKKEDVRHDWADKTSELIGDGTWEKADDDTFKEALRFAQERLK